MPLYINHKILKQGQDKQGQDKRHTAENVGFLDLLTKSFNYKAERKDFKVFLQIYF